jgi:hypothetical protein
MAGESISDRINFGDLREVVMSRIVDFGGEIKPFLVEPFCAQVAWMRTCPVYPFGGEDCRDHPCEYLYGEEYGDYKCPNADSYWAFKGVFERGTTEQRRAAEFLADMAIRYGTMENPPAEPSKRCVADAGWVYEGLGLIRKARLANQLWPAICRGGRFVFRSEALRELRRIVVPNEEVMEAVGA